MRRRLILVFLGIGAVALAVISVESIRADGGSARSTRESGGSSRPADPVPMLADYYQNLAGYQESCFVSSGYPQWEEVDVEGGYWQNHGFTEWKLGPQSEVEARELGMLGPDLNSSPWPGTQVAGGSTDERYQAVVENCSVLKSDLADQVEALEAHVFSLNQEAAAKARQLLAGEVTSVVSCTLEDLDRSEGAALFVDMMSAGEGPHLYPGLPTALASIGIANSGFPVSGANAIPLEGPVRKWTPPLPRVQPSEAEVQFGVAWVRCAREQLFYERLAQVLQEAWAEAVEEDAAELETLEAGLIEARARLQAAIEGE